MPQTQGSPFGALLRRWRANRHLTQEQLADDAEISTRHLSFLEGGKARPSREMVLVLASAKHRAGSIAADPAAPPTAHRHHQLSVYLARAYTETVCPDNAGSYAREVLDNAYRRAFTAAGQRMQAIGESDSDRAELTEQFAGVREELLDWWRRAEAAAQPGWADR